MVKKRANGEGNIRKRADGSFARSAGRMRQGGPSFAASASSRSVRRAVRMSRQPSFA